LMRAASDICKSSSTGVKLTDFRFLLMSSNIFSSTSLDWMVWRDWGEGDWEEGDTAAGSGIDLDGMAGSGES
jgi:hypothetical protein